MEPKREVQPWSDGRLPKVTCKAVKKNGDPCKRPPIKGSNVCRTHGGAAPQVIRAAHVRLAMAADPAAARLINIANDESMPAAVRLAANKEILDRANVVGTQQIQMQITEPKDWEKRFKSAIKVHYRRASRDSGESSEDIVDAEVVEDPEYEAMLDAEMSDNETERQDRKRKGRPARLPSEDKAEASTSTPRAQPVGQPVGQPEEDLSMVADPPTRMSDKEWHDGQLAKARRGDSGRLKPNPRVKRR